MGTCLCDNSPMFSAVYAELKDRRRRQIGFDKMVCSLTTGLRLCDIGPPLYDTTGLHGNTPPGRHCRVRDSEGRAPEAVGARAVHGRRHDRLLCHVLLSAQHLPPRAARELHGDAAGRRRRGGLPRRLQAERRLDPQLTGRRAVL